MNISGNVKYWTHVVFKWDDIRKYLSKEQRKQLMQINDTIAAGRVNDGKVGENKYYICNQDEPYAEKVLIEILKGEGVI